MNLHMGTPISQSFFGTAALLLTPVYAGSSHYLKRASLDSIPHSMSDWTTVDDLDFLHRKTPAQFLSRAKHQHPHGLTSKFWRQDLTRLRGIFEDDQGPASFDRHPLDLRPVDMYQTSLIILILLFISGALGADVSPADTEGVPVCINDRRTVSNIVWSCLVTIFASTWLAIHPNVPGKKIMDKGAISLAVERAKIMGIAILAPEVVVGWAAEQFYVAWRWRPTGKNCSTKCVVHAWRCGKRKDPHGLTLTHGFFLAMGGFCYTRTTHEQPNREHGTLDGSSPTRYSSEETVGPVTATSVSERIVTLQIFEDRESNFAEDLEAINVKMIQDKSKADGLSKTISMLQISWFITQWMTRLFQHLPITLLEITALASAVTSIITYSFWWHKPLNVQYPISLDKPDRRKYTPTPGTPQSPEHLSIVLDAMVSEEGYGYHLEYGV
ncbi:hypothetical protein ARMGADRAFT_1092366 [Armillaria gallica]|uniref:Uncharacterized protein n=1 Tax=Armillaria gallica TaxID=47427 RepID=A0A2H3CB22_ARMGA|nr:hypothetical protein ARMGADRAFT_1092366 [Armillaria gallica]